MLMTYLGPLFEALVYSLVWTMFSAAMMWLHSIPDAGHKRDLTVGAVFFGLRGFSQFVYAWGIVNGAAGEAWPLHMASAALGIGTGIYACLRVTHFAVTLVRSERIERLKRNTFGDDVMVNEMLPLASASLRQGIEEVRQKYEDRGIRCQGLPPNLPSPGLSLFSQPSAQSFR